MALPTITIDTATGSNTAASGAGPAVAVTGTAATLVNGSGNVAIADAVNLGSVATDGSAVLYVQVGSGRRFSKITGISGSSGAWTVAVEDTVWTAGSGLTWAIGGRRKDFETSNQNTKILLFSDAKPGWTLDLLDGTYTITSTITWGVKGDGTNGQIKLISSSTNRPIVTSATNSVPIITLNDADVIEIRHIKLTHTAATRGAGIRYATGASTAVAVRDCVIDGCSTAITFDVAACSLSGETTDITNSTTSGINIASATTTVDLLDCDIHDNAVPGVVIANVSGVIFRAERTIFDTNSYNVRATTTSNSPQIDLRNCTLVDATNDNIELATLGGSSAYVLTLIGNVFYGAGSGVDLDSGETEVELSIRYNRNNAWHGTHANLTASADSVTITVDPFNDRAARDFEPNDIAGGGALLRAAGVNGVDIGAIQHEEAEPDDSSVMLSTGVFLAA